MNVSILQKEIPNRYATASAVIPEPPCRSNVAYSFIIIHALCKWRLLYETQKTYLHDAGLQAASRAARNLQGMLRRGSAAGHREYRQLGRIGIARFNPAVASQADQPIYRSLQESCAA